LKGGGKAEKEKNRKKNQSPKNQNQTKYQKFKSSRFCFGQEEYKRREDKTMLGGEKKKKKTPKKQRGIRGKKQASPWGDIQNVTMECEGGSL